MSKARHMLGLCVVCAQEHYREDHNWLINGLGEILCIGCFNTRCEQHELAAKSVHYTPGKDVCDEKI